ncbi:hypothetical protein STEG23_018047, partial [Scotinomys teguina]
PRRQPQGKSKKKLDAKTNFLFWELLASTTWADVCLHVENRTDASGKWRDSYP